MNDLPAPLVPSHVDCRGQPSPRELFAQMAVLQFGIGIEDARAHVKRAAARMEGRRLAKRSTELRERL